MVWQLVRQDRSLAKIIKEGAEIPEVSWIDKMKERTGVKVHDRLEKCISPLKVGFRFSLVSDDFVRILNLYCTQRINGCITQPSESL